MLFPAHGLYVVQAEEQERWIDGERYCDVAALGLVAVQVCLSVSFQLSTPL